MQKLNLLILASMLAIPFSALSAKSKIVQPGMYIMATDYVKADGKTDVADALQKMIDDNPNHTIFFPDGTYMISHSICTPADPTKSVHLIFGNYAVVKASDNWRKDSGALIKLGGKYPFNNITTNGSNYGLEGGIFDGNGIADGISIDSGRETKIQNVSIKHTQIGLYIKNGANNGSSDADIHDVNIIGNEAPNSIGVLIDGHDNTLTNMRIAHVNTGVWVKGSCNSLRNIHPLFVFRPTLDYNTSCGFIVEKSRTICNYCYSDQFATGFKLTKGICASLTDCHVMWWTGRGAYETAIDSEGPFNSFVSNFHVKFNNQEKKNPTVTVLKAPKGGNGSIMHTNIMWQGDNLNLSSEDVSESYTIKY